jgi:hypothetical protein
MTIKILIDRTSVKLNPKYGKDLILLENAYTHKKLKIIGINPAAMGDLSRKIVNIGGFRTEDRVYFDKPEGERHDVVFSFIEEPELKALCDICKDVDCESSTYTVEGNPLVYHMMPQEKYLYSYLPTKITCGECSSIFTHTFLTHSDDYDPGDDYCPVCRHRCDVEFESPTNIIEENQNA